jgi:two-component system, NtrC family, response regulator AtoC
MADRARRHDAGSGGEADRSKRILVCDDDAGVRDMLANLLDDEGYEVIQAATGQQALDELTKHEEDRPALALLDIRMPDLDGIAVLQHMLEQGVDVPVILMTGFSTASKTIKAMQMGAADYLTKPFDLDEVTLTLQRVRSWSRRSASSAPARR